MSDCIYLGVDPGASGASAAIYPCGALEHIKHTASERDIFAFYQHLCGQAPTFALIEQVNAMPKQGVVSMFKFGQSFGCLRGMLIGAFIPFEMVTALKWQNAMKCRTGGNKNVSKARAQELWPTHKWTHATSDAFLIAEYGRRHGPFSDLRQEAVHANAPSE